MANPNISMDFGSITWMQTGSNQELDFTAEEWVVLPIELIARALANICRYNGHCSQYYSVAEHSVLISRMVPQELALAALLHDASEAYVGDMPTGLKRAMGISFKSFEHKAALAISKGYGIPVEDLESPVIKGFDKRILGDEAKLLLPPHRFWDKFVTEYEPTGVAIECWSPDVANAKFLERFAKLTGNTDGLPSECRNVVKFWPESKDKILSGQKTLTARKGQRFFHIGQVLEAKLNDTGEIFAKLQVEAVAPKTIGEMTQEDVKGNGYDTKENFWQGLLKSFPGTDESERFTLVKFKKV